MHVSYHLSWILYNTNNNLLSPFPKFFISFFSWVSACVVLPFELFWYLLELKFIFLAPKKMSQNRCLLSTDADSSPVLWGCSLEADTSNRSSSMPRMIQSVILLISSHFTLKYSIFFQWFTSNTTQFTHVFNMLSSKRILQTTLTPMPYSTQRSPVNSRNHWYPNQIYLSAAHSQ